MIRKIREELFCFSTKERAESNQRFFKTGHGEYGEGDMFIGLTVPDTRKIAKKYSQASDIDLKELLGSKIHEERLCALFILVEKFKKAQEKKKDIAAFYLDNISRVNNWDLVDLSADKILGNYLLDKDKAMLYQLATSKNLWERRIAIISTFAFIRNNQFEDTLRIAEILLDDKQDLIHKAVGWMLREVGKKNQLVEEEFLQKHYQAMPRTMLRYAIERFEEGKRKSYLRK